MHCDPFAHSPLRRHASPACVEPVNTCEHGLTVQAAGGGVLWPGTLHIFAARSATHASAAVLFTDSRPWRTPSFARSNPSDNASCANFSQVASSMNLVISLLMI